MDTADRARYVDMAAMDRGPERPSTDAQQEQEQEQEQEGARRRQQLMCRAKHVFFPAEY